MRAGVRGEIRLHPFRKASAVFIYVGRWINFLRLMLPLTRQRLLKNLLEMRDVTDFFIPSKQATSRAP
jgi:hypothetical protein